MTVRQRVQKLEQQGRCKSVKLAIPDVAGLVRLSQGGNGAVAIYRPGANADALAKAVRAANPHVQSLILLPDNGR